MLVIFDCDGVLVDSEIISSRVLAAEMTALGYPLSAAQCRERFTGISFSKVCARIEADWGRPLPDGFAARMRARDDAAFAAELEAVPGVAALLAAFAWPRCVASSGTPEKIRRNLTLTGLLPHFDPHLFSATQVAHGKPAPDLFIFAAETMGFAPADCVVVEDAVAGIQGARAAGMRVIGFAGAGHCGPGYGERLRAAGADVVIERMADLPGVLGPGVLG